MDILFFALSLSVFIISLAVVSNRGRATKEIPFDLEPNCLLTRYPLLFVTGPRSFFYFSKYWNIYTSFLAEHGYEVFTLNLPWNKTEYRTKRFLEFLEQQEQLGRKFHLLVDSPTLTEFEQILRQKNSPAILSLTEITQRDRVYTSSSLTALPVPKESIECHQSHKAGLLTLITYKIHQASLTKWRLPSLSTLGACTDTALLNSRLLLARAQALAENDLRST